MDPNNMNAAGMPNESSQSSVVEQALAKEPMTPSSASAPMGMPVKKSGKGMLYGMIIFIILAIGGIGFGVWAMMDGNTQKANLEKQISDLRVQNDQLLEQIAEGGNNNNTNKSYNNPIIESNKTDEVYHVYFIGYTVDSFYNNEHKVEIYVENGSVSTCRISGVGCTVSGLSGEIYKVIEFGTMPDGSESHIGFIMEDGSIQYLPSLSSDSGPNLSIAGTLNIDGYVIDAVGVSVYTGAEIGGGSPSTVFILRDGSIVEYNNSMLD